MSAKYFVVKTVLTLTHKSRPVVMLRRHLSLAEARTLAAKAQQSDDNFERFIFPEAKIDEVASTILKRGVYVASMLHGMMVIE